MASLNFGGQELRCALAQNTDKEVFLPPVSNNKKKEAASLKVKGHCTVAFELHVCLPEVLNADTQFVKT